MVSSLLYWNRNVDLDISSWIPYGVDYSPVSANRLHSDRLARIASLALDMDSELLFLRSFHSGNGGTLFRDHLYDPDRSGELELGFTLVFTYSRPIEKVLAGLEAKYGNVRAGLTLCGVWERAVLLDECKVVALVSEDPFFDEEGFLEGLEGDLTEGAGGSRGAVGFFAERFGYRRGSIPYETDDVVQMAIAQVLFDFTLEETRRIVGPPPEVAFPALLEGLPSPVEEEP